jgi:arginase
MDNKVILTPYFLDEPLPGLEHLAQPDWLINKPELPPGDRQARMGILYEPLAEFVAESKITGMRPVSIAGDCCTAIGVLGGLQRAGIDPLLIWFDAHGDFNTWETTPSGFLGGMPLAMLVGRGEQTILDTLQVEQHPENQVILTDARDLDPTEKLAVNSASLVHLRNVNDLLEYPLPGKPLYIHFDTDVLKPEEAPAMNYLAPGGPSSLELTQIFKMLNSSDNVVAVSLSSWNPELDHNGISERICMGLLHTLIGLDN